MQQLLGNHFSIRYDRFSSNGPKFRDICINEIIIGTSFNSINLPEYFYTNFVNSKNQKVYIIMKDFYFNIKNGLKVILNEYIFDELYYNGKNINRLLDIINESNFSNYNAKDIEFIFKLKNRKNPKIHIYIKLDNNKCYLLLIDLYHLSIPGDLYSNNRLQKRITLRDFPNIYQKFKFYQYNLNNIINENVFV